MRCVLSDPSVETEDSDSVTISHNSYDLLSYSIQAGAGTRGTGVSTLFAAELLLAIRRCAGDALQLPFRQLHTLVEEFDQHLTDVEATQLSDRRFEVLLSKEYARLLDWIKDWHVPWRRYLAFRLLDNDHPLHGLHRNMLQDLDISEARKVLILNTLKGAPDLCSCDEEVRQYMKTHIMPPSDPDFLRKSSPLVSGKLVLNMMVLREEAEVRYTSLRPEMFAMCHLYNGLFQLGMLKESWPALERITELYLEAALLRCPTNHG